MMTTQLCKFTENVLISYLKWVNLWYVNYATIKLFFKIQIFGILLQLAILPTSLKSHPGTSLVVQWLRLRAPNAGGPGSIPGQGTRSHMPQLKIPHAATKKRFCMLQLKDPTCRN